MSETTNAARHAPGKTCPNCRSYEASLRYEILRQEGRRAEGRPTSTVRIDRLKARIDKCSTW